MNDECIIAKQRGRVHACRKIPDEETGLVRGADRIETLCGKRLVQKAQVYASRQSTTLVTCVDCQKVMTGPALGAMSL